MSQAMHPDSSFEAAVAAVPDAIRRAIDREGDLESLVKPLMGPRAVVLGRGFNFSTAEEIALKLSETSYVLARAWSIADFEHGPIAIVEAGRPVLGIAGGGQVGSDPRVVVTGLDGTS